MKHQKAVRDVLSMEEIRILFCKNIEELADRVKNDASEKCLYDLEGNKRLLRFLDSNHIKYEIKRDCNKCIALSATQKTKIQNKDIVVYIGNNSIEQTIAEYFAEKSERKFLNFFNFREFLENKQELINSSKSICIICSKEYKALLQNDSGTENAEFNIGFITARNYWSLLFWINKLLVCDKIESNNVVIVNRVDKTSQEMASENGITYIPYMAASKDNVIKATKKNTSALTLIGHGRDELIWLTNAILCGKCDNLIQEGEMYTPNCVQNGKCFKEETDVMKVADLNCYNVFINACCSAKMSRAVFGDTYNLMYAFSESNAANYIGTPFLANGCEALNYYYTAMLKANFQMGEIIKLLNRLYNSYEFGEKNSYFLFGDPITSFGDDTNKLRINMEIKEGISEFNITKNIWLIELHFKGDIFSDFINYKRDILIKNQENDKLFCHIFYNKKENLTVFHVFSVFGIKRGKYYLLNNLRKDIKMEDISELQCWFELGFLDSKLKNYYYESLNSAKNYYQTELFSRIRIDNINLTNYSKREKITKRRMKLFYDFTESFINKIHTKGLAFDEACLANGFVVQRREGIRSQCPYCGSDLYKSTVCNKLFHIIREHVYCTKCGNILDEPLDSAIEIIFEGNDKYKRKGKHSFVNLKVKNIGDSSVQGYVGYAIVNGQKEEFVYNKNYTIINLGRAEELTVQCCMYPSKDVVCHNYWLMAVAVINSKIYVIKRDIYYEN